jgi:hypothetical protein
LQVFRGLFRKIYRILCSIFTITADNEQFVILISSTKYPQSRQASYGKYCFAMFFY